MKKITILSGKGGVGKSSITASLAIALSKKYKVVAADCDVDAANLALVFGIKELNWEPVSTKQKAVIDYSKCNRCKKCYELCFFDAIAWDDNPMIKEFGCEGCGLCEISCPENAIKLMDIENAKIASAKTVFGYIVTAQLGIGESGSGKLVTAVRKQAEETDADIMLIDAAAGIGCPVIASVAGIDYAVLVTEPTPSAFSDLKRALKLVEHFNVKSGLIINKFDINENYSEKIKKFAQDNNMDMITTIPYDKKFIEAIVNLKPIILFDDSYENVFNKIIEKLNL